MNDRVRQTYYRFINRSHSRVKIFWLINKSNRKYYESLDPGEFLDVDTYPDHFWYFEKHDSGDAVLADGACLFTSDNLLDFIKSIISDALKKQRFSGEAPRITRKLVTLEEPLYTLRQLCLHTVRDHLNSISKIDLLDIPQSLKDDLKGVALQKHCAHVHGPTCVLCPFTIHKPNFSHVCIYHKFVSMLRRTK